MTDFVMQYPPRPTVGARFQRARFPVKIDPIVLQGAFETRPYRAGSARLSISLAGKQFAPIRHRAHDDAIVREVQEHIDAHLDDPIQIALLAEQSGVSERTLTRRFTAATGLGPQAYLQLVRVNLAQRLLETTCDPIESVRRASGYQDSAAFRRVFKQVTGLSPSEYRSQRGARQPNRRSEQISS